MTKREVEMKTALSKVQEMVDELGKPITLLYRKETEESIEEFSEHKRRYHYLAVGEEYIYVYAKDGLLHYAVNVTADSILTAMYELFELLHRKF